MNVFILLNSLGMIISVCVCERRRTQLLLNILCTTAFCCCCFFAYFLFCQAVSGKKINIVTINTSLYRQKHLVRYEPLRKIHTLDFHVEECKQCGVPWVIAVLKSLQRFIINARSQRGCVEPLTVNPSVEPYVKINFYLFIQLLLTDF